MTGSRPQWSECQLADRQKTDSSRCTNWTPVQHPVQSSTVEWKQILQSGSGKVHFVSFTHRGTSVHHHHPCHIEHLISYHLPARSCNGIQQTKLSYNVCDSLRETPKSAPSPSSSVLQWQISKKCLYDQLTYISVCSKHDAKVMKVQWTSVSMGACPTSP